MATHANPSRDPANDETLVGLARQILDKFLQGVDDMLPAKVISYDRTTNRATVLPMVKVLTTDNRAITRAQVSSIPVLMLGGGDQVITFPLQAGDLGWIKANDRDISLVLQSYSENAPNTLRKHSFQDALFIPDVMRNVTIAAEDTDNATFQNNTGTVRVALWPTQVKVTATNGLTVADSAGVSSSNALVFDVRSTVKPSRPWPKVTEAQMNAMTPYMTSDDDGAAVWVTDHHKVYTWHSNTMAWHPGVS